MGGGLGLVTNGEFKWQDESACSKPENEDIRENFFSAKIEKKYEAKNLCFSCPVRKECMLFALEHKQIWGIWGGRDEMEIRRTLSVDANGEEARRRRYPQCPYCSARTSNLSTEEVPSKNGGRWATTKLVTCGQCGFAWRSRTSANAVDAYFKERATKSARSSKKKRST
jgi:WhiB family redox-sensing transcriptional regulator